MRSSNSQINKGFDWITLSIYLSLVIIGWLMLYATSYSEWSVNSQFTFSSTIGKQTIWVFISLFAFMCAMVLDWKFWNSISYFLYAFSILLLIAVLVVGVEIKGATSWFSFGSFSFQPAEFAKLSTSLALASFLSFYKTNIIQFKYLLQGIGIFFLPSFLILLQPDAGSALIFFSFFILLYRKGFTPVFYILGILFILAFLFSIIYDPLYVSAGILLLSLLAFLLQLEKKLVWAASYILICTAFITLYQMGNIRESFILLGIFIALFSTILWQKRKQQFILLMISGIVVLVMFSFGTKFAFDNFLRPHQQDRLNVWLNPAKSDPQGSLYNIIQSKTAIGSGGIQGKGFLNGTMTKLNYVPEQTTDFIFSTVGEEQGFIGVVGIVVLFTILLYRIIVIAERAKHKFIQYYAYCIAGIIFLHYFINIGMTMGLMPVIGIPLPFISKGGSSLLVFSIMMGALLRMDLARIRGRS